jgi:hypothetical protein
MLNLLKSKKKKKQFKKRWKENKKLICLKDRKKGIKNQVTETLKD